MSIADSLHRYGTIVIPVLTDDYHNWVEKIWKAIEEFPEYKVKGKNVQRVLGGFGGYGNPSSFHDPVIRQFRLTIKKIVAELVFKPYAENFEPNNDKLEMLFDRICVRHKDFGNVSKESWHRDIYDCTLNNQKKSQTTDNIFGGWVNLSNNMQHFVCIIGTHNDAHEGDKGFALIKDNEKKKLNDILKLQANNTYGHVSMNSNGHVKVPPGHAVIFFQHILHTVLNSLHKSQEPELRIFCGYRLTNDEKPLLEYDIDNMSVPILPSGQVPPMYSKNHYMHFNKSSKFRKWAENTFHERCLFQRKTTDGIVYYTPGSQISDSKINKQRSMCSLKEMGFESIPYSDEDIKVLTPEIL